MEDPADASPVAGFVGATPEVDFRLQSLDAARTQVFLDFHVAVPLPPIVRQLGEAVLGRRVRALHVKDLQELKWHVETAPAAA